MRRRRLSPSCSTPTRWHPAQAPREGHGRAASLDFDDYTRLLVEHPLLGTLVRRLAWASFGNDGQVLATFWVTDTHTMVDVDGSAADVGASGGSIGLAHPVQLVHDLERWTEVFARHEILQPFAQLDRGTYSFTDEGRAAAKLHRFDEAIVPSGKVLGLERVGWERGQPEDNGNRRRMERLLPHGGRLLLHLDPGIHASELGYFPEQTLQPLGIIEGASNRYGYSNTTFGELDVITASEILRDLTTLTTP